MAVELLEVAEASFDIESYQALVEHTWPPGVKDGCLVVLAPMARDDAAPGLPSNANYRGPHGGGDLVVFAQALLQANTSIMIYYLLDPPVGANQLELISPYGPAWAIVLLSLSGVHRIGPLFALASSDSGSSSSDMLFLPQSIPAGAMAFDSAAISLSPAPAPTWTPGAGQTARSNQIASAGTRALRGAASSRTTAPAQLAFTLSAAAQWVHLAFIVAAAKPKVKLAGRLALATEGELKTSEAMGGAVSSETSAGKVGPVSLTGVVDRRRYSGRFQGL